MTQINFTSLFLPFLTKITNVAHTVLVTGIVALQGHLCKGYTRVFGISLCSALPCIFQLQHQKNSLIPHSVVLASLLASLTLNFLPLYPTLLWAHCKWKGPLRLWAQSHLEQEIGSSKLALQKEMSWAVCLSAPTVTSRNSVKKERPSNRRAQSWREC